MRSLKPIENNRLLTVALFGFAGLTVGLLVACTRHFYKGASARLAERALT